MTKNIFITGRPGCGKTTLIKELIKGLNLDAGGFYTQEIREKGARLGFKIVTLDGKPRTRTSSVRGREGILAHVNVKSPYHVSKYKVNIKDLEEIGVKSILDSLEKNKVTLIDEIGKMEMMSEKFKGAVRAALESKNKVLGTIKLTGDPFTSQIKERKDTKIFYLTRANYQEIKEEIRKEFGQ